jgi:hypothetical protein
LELFSDEIDPDTKIMLTNAIYFKEAWSVAFTKVAGETRVSSLDIIFTEIKVKFVFYGIPIYT